MCAAIWSKSVRRGQPTREASQELLLQLVVFWFMPSRNLSTVDCRLHTRKCGMGYWVWNIGCCDGFRFCSLFVRTEIIPTTGSDRKPADPNSPRPCCGSSQVASSLNARKPRRGMAFSYHGCVSRSQTPPSNKSDQVSVFLFIWCLEFKMLRMHEIKIFQTVVVCILKIQIIR